MLLGLSIRDFVIVDKLDLEFSAGFTVLTGETGAGKSILIDALSLALGARGEAGYIRNGCERAEINLAIEIANNAELNAWLSENEFVVESSELILRRIIYSDGRSRAFIGGLPATIQQLKEVGDFLVDIYSQHAHHSLLKTSYQRQILDGYAGLLSLAEQVSASFKVWQTLDTKLKEYEKNALAYADELAELRDTIRELNGIVLSAEDWELLQQEHVKLSNGASLLAATEEALSLLSENEYSVVSQLNRAQHKVQGLVGFDPELQSVVTEIDSALIQLEDASRYLNRYLQKTELDPERLTEVEAQIQALHQAARKYRIRPEDLSAYLEKSKLRMDELASYTNENDLAKQVQSAMTDYMALATKLSQGRAKSAETLSEKITHEMQHLALSGGQFSVALNPQAPNPNGLELVEFLVAGHVGGSAKPLAKVASGGELSRISLAIRVTTAQLDEIPTMIFDEVDVGIGGGVAETVGNLLAQLGENRQILVITHLPQVAAKGEHHLRVSKRVENQQTISRIQQLSQDERIDEVARMLGGVEITNTTKKHAAEMLGIASELF